MNSTADILLVATTTLGDVFSMGLGATCAAFMWWGFGRG